VIIRESHLDTNATTQSIRTKLSNLDIYINTINSDITKFNGYVKGLILSLKARGQRTEDLLKNLFKGYLAASDKVFVKYIASKMEKYEEGKDIDPDQLRQLADNKYRLMKKKQTWEAPSEEKEKILALQAEVSLLKKRDGKSKATNPSRKKTGNERQNRNNQGNKKNRFKGRKQKAAQAKPEGMSSKPKKELLKKLREWNELKWWWCGAETGGKCEPAQWRAHRPSERRGLMRKQLHTHANQGNENKTESRRSLRSRRPYHQL
jgi:hypothetical protein